MNPDDGTDAEDWFAKFEREAREAAQKRESEDPAARGSGCSGCSATRQPVRCAARRSADRRALRQPQPQSPLPPLPQPPAQPHRTAAAPTAAGASRAGTSRPKRWDASSPNRPRRSPPSRLRRSCPPPSAFPGEEPASALDSLFGDDAFREYEDGLGPDPSNAPFANRGRSKELVVVPGGDGTPPAARATSDPSRRR